MNFDKVEEKCVICGKSKGLHKATTLNCPEGKKHRVLGYLSYHPTNKFQLHK